VDELEAEVEYDQDPDEYEPSNIYDNNNVQDREIPVKDQLDFIEGLIQQLDAYKFKNWQREIAEEILWNLDENGYDCMGVCGGAGQIIDCDDYDGWFSKDQEIKAPTTGLYSTINDGVYGATTDTGGDETTLTHTGAFDGFTESMIESAAGFSITKVDDDNYTFTASSGTATSGSVLGGGGVASAGPVTVSP